MNSPVTSVAKAVWDFFDSIDPISDMFRVATQAWDSGQTSYFRHGDTASVTLMETQSKE